MSWLSMLNYLPGPRTEVTEQLKLLDIQDSLIKHRNYDNPFECCLKLYNFLFTE